MRLFRVGFLALASVACSTTPAITLVATPNPVPGDGLTTITVTATATEGGTPSSGATVHFKTSLGSFIGATGDGTTIDQTADDQGHAVVTMLAPRQGFGTINLTASFSAQGKEPSKTFAVTLQPSGGLAASIVFTCTTHNIGALVFNRQSDVHMLCRATARDVNGRIIPHASVQTLAEAGTLQWLDDSNGVQEFVYTVRPDDAPPKDVRPCDSSSKSGCIEQDVCPTSCNGNPFGAACEGEPCWTDNGGVTHNPRDGVATLIAAVPAQPQFDLTEPFVDENDDGVWNPGEPFIDYNGNGRYDGTTASSAPGMVWKPFRVIWSGAASLPPSGGGTLHYSYMAQEDPLHRDQITAHFFDQNLNNIAADSAAGSDGVSWVAACSGGSGDGTFPVGDTALTQVNPGIQFIEESPDVSPTQVGWISAPGNRGTYTQVSITNGIASSTGDLASQNCSVTATPHRCNDPGAPGYQAQCEGADIGLTFTGFTF